MVGCMKGPVSFIKKQNENFMSTHCFLHREALISNSLKEKLKEVFDQVVQVANFVRRDLVNRGYSNKFASIWILNTDGYFHTPM